MLSVSTFVLLLHAVPAGHPFRCVHDDTAHAYALDRVPPVRDLYVNVNVNVNVAKGKHQQQNVHHPHPNAQQSQSQHPAPAGGAAELLGAQRDDGWAQLQASLPHVQPMPGEVEEMECRANEVERLLEELRCMGGVPAGEAQPMQVDPDMDADQRTLKRWWEEVEMDNQVDEFEDPQPPYPTPTDMKPSPPLQTTAEQDLELIHMKRAMTAAGGSGGWHGPAEDQVPQAQFWATGDAAGQASLVQHPRDA
ncbi:hypothetical protein B0H10DRAFT_2184361 [Mycena sp. CBHHK59/15]|nr:hypothetical protein B0H10DRAFT_2184361 [Mycena sp. CBHHK59/15]